jgi:hypothetical protein
VQQKALDEESRRDGEFELCTQKLAYDDGLDEIIKLNIALKNSHRPNRPQFCRFH